MILSGRTSLLALIDAEKTRQGLSELEICLKAGVGRNTISNIRCERYRGINMATVLALVNALGLVLTTAPE